jgi:hypothetical protein
MTQRGRAQRSHSPPTILTEPVAACQVMWSLIRADSERHSIPRAALGHLGLQQLFAGKGKARAAHGPSGNGASCHNEAGGVAPIEGDGKAPA